MEKVMQPGKMVTVEVAVKSRLVTRSFAISTDLLGAYHEFIYESHSVKVELPNASEVKDEDLHSGRAYKGFEPTSVFIKNVDVILSTDQKVRVPERSLNMTFERDLYPFQEKQYKELNELTRTFSNIAFKAYEKWARIMRWKARASINGPEVRHDIRVKAPSLIDKNTGKQFYFTGMSRGVSYRVINTEDWERAQESLNNDEIPPVHVDLLIDAVTHFNTRDLQRCVVDLAVACESFLRTKVMDQVPLGTPDSFRSYIDEVNIRRVLSHFVDDILDKSEKKRFSKIRSELNQLFDARNKIAHTGRKDDLTVEQCWKFVRAAYSLIQGRESEEDGVNPEQ